MINFNVLVSSSQLKPTATLEQPLANAQHDSVVEFAPNNPLALMLSKIFEQPNQHRRPSTTALRNELLKRH